MCHFRPLCRSVQILRPLQRGAVSDRAGQCRIDRRMPSPVGTCAKGASAIAGRTCTGCIAPAGRRAADTGTAAILAAVAIAPDLDLARPRLTAANQPQHRRGASSRASSPALIATKSPRWGAAIALAWASHILLDWLSNDTRPPLGVMALWPLTRDYYKAAHRDFPAGVAALLGVALLDLQPAGGGDRSRHPAGRAAVLSVRWRRR